MELTLAILLVTTGRVALGAEPTPLQPLASAVGAASTSLAGPRIQFAATEYDFGKAVGGEVLKHEFIFTNAGDRLLEVSEVRTSCGCTTAGAWSKQVEPGNQGTIPIELLTANLGSGQVEKLVTVICNDTNQPIVMLSLKGTVWRPIELIPSSAALTSLMEAPSNAVTVVRIINKQEVPLTLSAPESSHRAVAAELITLRPGQDYQLCIRLVPPLGLGNIFGNITLRTSAAKVPVLTIPFWGVARSAVTVMPSQLVLPAGPVSNQMTQTVTIRSTWTNSLTLSEPRLNAPSVGVQVKELQPGRFFTLLLTYPKGFQIGPGEKVELSFKSNHPQFPVITVPVIQPLPVPAVAPAKAPAAGRIHQSSPPQYR